MPEDLPVPHQRGHDFAWEDFSRILLQGRQMGRGASSSGGPGGDGLSPDVGGARNEFLEDDLPEDDFPDF